MPRVSMPRSGAARLCVVHRNIPNMIGSVLQLVSAQNVNVENMMNKSRGDYAYTLIDLGSSLSSDMIAQLEKIDGVLRVRLIH